MDLRLFFLRGQRFRSVADFCVTPGAGRGAARYRLFCGWSLGALRPDLKHATVVCPILIWPGDCACVDLGLLSKQALIAQA